MLQAQLSQDLQRTAREKLEVQNQLAGVRVEQDQLQVRLIGSSTSPASTSQDTPLQFTSSIVITSKCFTKHFPIS